MVLLKNFINIFFVPELRKKMLFTLGILIIYRLGYHIPVIGIDIPALKAILAQAKGIGGLFSRLDLFSGGSLRNCTIFALGIMPYIQASLMMQLLGMTIPYLEALLKEGEYGRKVVNQYTRYLAFALSIVQAAGYITIIKYQGLVQDAGWPFYFMFILTLSVGSMFVMWLGEQISLFGIGNGASVIIFAGIVAQLPKDVITTWAWVQEGHMDIIVAFMILFIYLAITAMIVFLEKGERKIPVQYTRRIVGQKVYGGQSSYIPFKINTSGVMPVIFASSVLGTFTWIATFLAAKFESLKWLVDAMQGGLQSVLTFLLIIFFSFVYTALVFNPEELAENIKKSGGFIPGIRPGRKTAEFFNYILTRIGLAGAIYLALLAILPDLLRLVIKMPFDLGGTSLLIVVGVALEIAAQVEAYLIEHKYSGFLSSGRLKARGAR